MQIPQIEPAAMVSAEGVTADKFAARRLLFKHDSFRPAFAGRSIKR
jgi:hypothetical protein